jgi:ATP-dependent Clp protease ATP-binding subunit ClpB
MAAIVRIQLARLKAMLAERKITLTLEPEAELWLGEAGYDPVYGARPLKRVIQRSLQDKLANLLLAGEVMPNAELRVSVQDEELRINQA